MIAGTYLKKIKKKIIFSIQIQKVFREGRTHFEKCPILWIIKYHSHRLWGSYMGFTNVYNISLNFPIDPINSLRDIALRIWALVIVQFVTQHFKPVFLETAFSKTIVNIFQELLNRFWYNFTNIRYNSQGLKCDY